MKRSSFNASRVFISETNDTRRPRESLGLLHVLIPKCLSLAGQRLSYKYLVQLQADGVYEADLHTRDFVFLLPVHEILRTQKHALSCID